MYVRSQRRGAAMPLAARSMLQLDYLKLTVWLMGALVPWMGIAALYLGR